MMRKLFVAGNWKMNKTIAESKELVQVMLPELVKYAHVDMAVCPSYLAVAPVAELCKGSVLKVGAQNVYWEESGAFTGEVAPQMVAEVCDDVIVGHSERRALFGETDETVNKRLKAGLAAGLHVIVCVGETLEENESGQTEAVVSRQMREGLAGITAEQAAHITIAYEPVWAIGTGRAATPEDANNVHKNVIRPLLTEQFGRRELFSMSDIDGGLVGGASLDADSFIGIVKAASMVTIIAEEAEGSEK